MSSQIESLLAESTHPTDSCVLFSLLWLAAADGEPNVDEFDFIREKLSIEDLDVERSGAMLAIIAAGDTDSYVEVFRRLREDLSGDEKQFLLELAVAMAVADRRLSSAENHILQFYADLLGFDFDYLRALYLNVSGSELPETDDPGSLRWWERRDAGRQSRPGNVAGAMSTGEALQVLGLQEGAGQREIKKACKRLLQLHHPDRHHLKGESARKEAENTFIRIRQAYEVLRR